MPVFRVVKEFDTYIEASSAGEAITAAGRPGSDPGWSNISASADAMPPDSDRVKNRLSEDKAAREAPRD